MITIGPNKTRPAVELIFVLCFLLSASFITYLVVQDLSAGDRRIWIRGIPAVFMFGVGSLSLLWIFRSFRLVQYDDRVIEMRKWLREPLVIPTSEVVGYSACKWRLSSTTQGLILYSTLGETEVFDTSVGDLSSLRSFLQAKGVTFFGNESVWWPHLRVKHRYSKNS